MDIYLIRISSRQVAKKETVIKISHPIIDPRYICYIEMLSVYLFNLICPSEYLSSHIAYLSHPILDIPKYMYIDMLHCDNFFNISILANCLP